ncbi:hypothetical protein LTR04_002450 [Oleoguttula sp. CCFEE 6159]|nr:hypothetical protein LTR04_002450 [Oleoguttula sp. CCFEE 6159]
MDNVDGKQARRTGTSSGLGELFDHGIDSLNCTLGSLLETAAMGYGATKTGTFTALVPCLPMFFSTWETYHTHTLYLGYFNGPTEGLILACSIMLISGYYGPGVWSLPVADYFGYPEIFGTYSMRELWVPILIFSFFTAHLPACVTNVIKARREKNLPVAPVFLEWTPMIVFTGATGAWLYSPYSTLLKENHLCLFCLTVSFVFGRMTTKIILAHLTRQPFPYWTVLITPLVGGAVLANLPFVGFTPFDADTEYYYLWAYFVFAFVVYFRWAFLVIGRICEFLSINCLTIPPKGRDKEGEKQGSGKLELEKRVANGGTGVRKAD